MKDDKKIFSGWRKWAVLALVAIAVGLVEPAYCQTNGTALLLQQTPADGGTVSPDIGVHQFDLNANVTLTATPKPGYQFVYWIGEVSDHTASKTVAYINSPKIIVAVFERSEYDFQMTEESAPNISSIGGLFRSAADYARGGGGGGGRKRNSYPTQPIEPEWPFGEFPVPEEPNKDDQAGILVPEIPAVPEPATIMLLGAGAALVLRRRRETK